MKNIILTTTILFISIQFNFNYKYGNEFRSSTQNIVLNEINGANKLMPSPDSLLKKSAATEETKKYKEPKITKEMSGSKRSKRWVSKATSVNQANLKLHKHLSQGGNHVTKTAVQFAFDKYELKDNKAFNDYCRLRIS